MTSLKFKKTINTNTKQTTFLVICASSGFWMSLFSLSAVLLSFYFSSSRRFSTIKLAKASCWRGRFFRICLSMACAFSSAFSIPIPTFAVNRCSPEQGKSRGFALIDLVLRIRISKRKPLALPPLIKSCEYITLATCYWVSVPFRNDSATVG